MMTEPEYWLYNVALVLLFIVAWAIPVLVGLGVYYLCLHFFFTRKQPHGHQS